MPNAAILNQFFLSTQHLNLLEKHIGLKYIKGPFKKAEDDKLKDFVEDYCRRAQLNIDGFRALLFEDKTLRQGSFWIDITSQLQDRPVISVYHHIRRMFHATARQGMWTSGEDEKLRELVMSYGRAWEKIGKKMGSRASFDCKDRWDNHLRFNEDSELVKRLGEWSQDEVERLKVAVRAAEEEMHQPAAKGLMLWSEVAEKVGTRNRQQCAAKWSVMA